jgi:hypothetical protein
VWAEYALRNRALEIFRVGRQDYVDRTSTNIMASFNPTQIFDDGTTEEKGENARLSAFVGAIAVGGKFPELLYYNIPVF